VALLLAGGGSDEPAKPPTPPKPQPGVESVRVQVPGGAAGAKAPPPAPIDPAKAELLAEVRKRGFRNEDFVEGEGNRDPFRCFLSNFAGGQAITTQYKILLPKYSLDELKLIAIVGPPTVDSRGRTIRLAHGRSAQERAMFLDPAQTGVSVVRGEHLSKADARVTRIDSEKGKVYVELKEELGAGKTRTVERVIELHQGDAPEGASQ
jgi:hypothetical protein